MKFKGPYQIYALTAIAGWSLSYVFTRVALRHFSPLPLACLRYLAASASICALAAFIPIEKPKKGDGKWFTLAGACGFFLYATFFNIGSKAMQAASSSLVIATAPVITSIIASFAFHERLGARKWAAVAIEFAGVAAMAILGGGFHAGSGLLPMLFAAFLLSLYNLISRRLTKIYSGFTVASQAILRGSAMLLAYAGQAAAELRGAPPSALASVAVIGVFSSAVAYACWSVALSKAAQASSVANYMFATPFLTAVLGIAVAGEAIGPSTLIGGALILFGFVLYNAPTSKAAPRLRN